jgi:hypothetical protein
VKCRRKYEMYLAVFRLLSILREVFAARTLKALYTFRGFCIWAGMMAQI